MKNKDRKPMRMEARRHLILEYIAKGMRYNQIIEKCASDWKLSPITVELYVNDALAYMRSDSTKDSLISMNMERLDNIITDSMKDDDRKNAIKAIDTQNKLIGGYEEKIKLDSDNEINLVFEIGE